MDNQPDRSPRTVRPRSSQADRYRWVALTNTTMAVFMSSLDGSIILIALPAIFTGIHLDPPANRNLLTGREFFPNLISDPFHNGLIIVFAVSAALGVIAAIVSLLRGGNTPPADTAAAVTPAAQTRP